MRESSPRTRFGILEQIFEHESGSSAERATSKMIDDALKRLLKPHKGKYYDMGG